MQEGTKAVLSWAGGPHDDYILGAVDCSEFNDCSLWPAPSFINSCTVQPLSPAEWKPTSEGSPFVESQGIFSKTVGHFFLSGPYFIPQKDSCDALCLSLELEEENEILVGNRPASSENDTDFLCSCPLSH